MSTIVVVFLLPTSIYSLVYFLTAQIPPMHPYSWEYVHSNWDFIAKYPSHGLPVKWDRWLWISCAYIVFFCSGIGREARGMYRNWLLAMGFGRIFTGLEKVAQPSTSETKDSSAWYSSVGSKAKLLFNRKSIGTTMTDSL